ncbi:MULTISPECIES: hypothetical protein [unclassified Bradyrhizobium]|uniref:hypothetical protein n=1 Tax=unclassified Bradyrhizobium TaxID=2631580 RepID=UPI003183F6DF
MAADGDDYRRLPLKLRKPNLARLLRNRSERIQAAPFEQGEIGTDLFRHACIMGLEGMVSKQVDRAYREGRCRRGARSVSQPPTPTKVLAVDGYRNKPLRERLLEKL